MPWGGLGCSRAYPRSVHVTRRGPQGEVYARLKLESGRGCLPSRDSPQGILCPEHGFRGVLRSPLQVQIPAPMWWPTYLGHPVPGRISRSLRVRLIPVQILRLQQFSLHLRIRPIYQEHANACG